MAVVFLCNPQAGRGRSRSLIARILKAFGDDPEASVLETRHPGHAIELAAQAALGGADVVACGGDGTLHEVVNGVVGKNVSVGVLPAGSANDFIKTFASEVPPEAIGSALPRLVDLGLVRFSDGHEEYFINSFGFGFTGRVAMAVRQCRYLRGELAYLAALFRVLIGYTPLKMHITITCSTGIVELDGPVFALSIGNGRIEGGRFRIAPEAELDDGCLDVCILKSISRFRFVPFLFRYLRGTQGGFPEVFTCSASRIDVRFGASDAMHLDGEVRHPGGTSFSVRVVPAAARVFDGRSLTEA